MTTERKKALWREATVRYRVKNPNKGRDYMRAKRANNPDFYENEQAQKREWYAANPEKEIARRDKWRRANLAMDARSSALRRARVKSQTCLCCTDYMFLEWYIKAHDQGLEVDHIKPIAKGGIHCTENFQLLTKSENCSKGASFDYAD